MCARRGVVLVVAGMVALFAPVFAVLAQGAVTLSAWCLGVASSAAGAADGSLISRWVCAGGNASTLGEVVIDAGALADLSNLRLHVSAVGSEAYCGTVQVFLSWDGVDWRDVSGVVTAPCGEWVEISLYARARWVKVARTGQSAVTIDDVFVSPVMANHPDGQAGYVPYGLDSWGGVAGALSNWFNLALVGGALVATVGLSLAPEIMRALALLVKYRGSERSLGWSKRVLLDGERARLGVRKDKEVGRELVERYGRDAE